MKDDPDRVDCEFLDMALTILRVRYGPRKAGFPDIREIAGHVAELADLWDGLEDAEASHSPGCDHDD